MDTHSIIVILRGVGLIIEQSTLVTLPVGVPLGDILTSDAGRLLLRALRLALELDQGWAFALNPVLLLTIVPLGHGRVAAHVQKCQLPPGIETLPPTLGAQPDQWPHSPARLVA